VLGFSLLRETFREERQSYKADLFLNGIYMIELLSFPNPPNRVSFPEAAGLRHLAFQVDNIRDTFMTLQKDGICCQAVRIDEITGKEFFFIEDPDGLPIEFYAS